MNTIKYNHTVMNLSSLESHHDSAPTKTMMSSSSLQQQQQQQQHKQQRLMAATRPVSKSIPMGGMRRSPSEIQFLEDQAEADYRDHRMFSRLVHGIQHQNERSNMATTSLSLQSDQNLIANLIQTRNQPIYYNDTASSWTKNAVSDRVTRNARVLESVQAASKLLDSFSGDFADNNDYMMSPDENDYYNEDDDEDSGDDDAIFALDL